MNFRFDCETNMKEKDYYVTVIKRPSSVIVDRKGKVNITGAEVISLDQQGFSLYGEVLSNWDEIQINHNGSGFDVSFITYKKERICND